MRGEGGRIGGSGGEGQGIRGEGTMGTKSGRFLPRKSQRSRKSLGRVHQAGRKSHPAGRKSQNAKNVRLSPYFRPGPRFKAHSHPSHWQPAEQLECGDAKNVHKVFGTDLKLQTGYSAVTQSGSVENFNQYYPTVEQNGPGRSAAFNDHHGSHAGGE